jgi:hypothetical protein
MILRLATLFLIAVMAACASETVLAANRAEFVRFVTMLFVMLF